MKLIKRNSFKLLLQIICNYLEVVIKKKNKFGCRPNVLMEKIIFGLQLLNETIFCFLKLNIVVQTNTYQLKID